MKRYILFAFALFALSATVSAQIPLNTHIQILAAEDARRYDKTLEDLMKHPNADIRNRAALAAGRIGDSKAVPILAELMKSDSSADVQRTAAFAIGEIESMTAADALLDMLKICGVQGVMAKTDAVAMVEAKLTNGRLPPLTVKNVSQHQARIVEAAGKIAAANLTDPKTKEMGKGILDTLECEHAKGAEQDRDVVLLALTAALRARPEGADKSVAKFLTNPDARVRADAANTLSRVRAKNANETLRTMVASDADPIARANAARALGAAEDKDAVEVLIDAVVKDADSRVRVSAIRSLIPLRDVKVVDHLIARGRDLMRVYDSRHREIDGPEQVLPAEKSELLEIATALGRLLANTKHEEGWRFLEAFRYVDKHYSSEVEIAMARVDPARYLTVSNIGGVYMSRKTRKESYDWRVANNLFAALNEYAAFPADGPLKNARAQAQKKVEDFLDAPFGEFPKADPVSFFPAIANAIATLARFKPADMKEVAIRHLVHPDSDVRAAAASALGDLPNSKESVDALKAAFTKALLTDKIYNDAQFAILAALNKLDKKESVGMLLIALSAPDYLLRRRAFTMLGDKDLQKDFPGIPTSLENARKVGKDLVLTYNAASGTHLGQVLNTRQDYVRALSRKNGSVKAVLTTEKGTFTIDFTPEDAPLTVDNFVTLARRGYFNGVSVHRVVPNFVMQDGDPRGDGNGGPGWSIRCEVNMLMYERGMVGMALSGKDTGGSQWFVTHSPQPHLDGGYTIFGKVNEAGMKVVDNIVRGDKIISVRIIGR